MVRQVLVLDIETVLDREALQRVGRTGPAGFPRPCLHRVAAVSLLRYVTDESRGTFGDFNLVTLLALSAADEPEVLHRLEQHMPEGSDAMLITFNGTHHDLPMLRFRRLRHGMYEASRLDDFVGTEIHRDMMLHMVKDGGLRWPQLADACAALDIPHYLPQRWAAADTPHPLLIKGQTDVLATFLLYHIYVAREVHSADPFTNAWTALAEYLISSVPLRPDLLPFASGARKLPHPSVEERSDRNGQGRRRL